MRLRKRLEIMAKLTVTSVIGMTVNGRLSLRLMAKVEWMMLKNMTFNLPEESVARAKAYTANSGEIENAEKAKKGLKFSFALN